MVVGNQIPHALHLDDKQYARLITLLPRFYQAVKVADAPFCRRIWKAADAVFL